MTTPSVVYLHGFASSPHGDKAAWFHDRFATIGVPFHAPDLNVPTFETLTVTACIERAREEVEACRPGPVYVVASSMGALVTLHLIDRYREATASRIQKLLFMAPAFNLKAAWDDLHEDDLAYWKMAGSIPVFHHGVEDHLPLHYGFYEDVQGLKDSYEIAAGRPLLIFHGLHDQTVPHSLSERYAAEQPDVTLRLVDSDHMLLDQVEEIWATALPFFGLSV